MQFKVAAPIMREAIERIMRAAFGPYVRKLGRELTASSYDWLTDAVACGNIYAGWDGADVVGAVVTTPRDSELVLDMIAVEPTRQGTGIGSWLLSQMEETARDTGFRHLSLDTAEMMADLLRFYAKRGFHEVRRGPPLHGKDVHTRVFFTKLLQDAGDLTKST